MFKNKDENVSNVVRNPNVFEMTHELSFFRVSYFASSIGDVEVEDDDEQLSSFVGIPCFSRRLNAAIVLL